MIKFERHPNFDTLRLLLSFVVFFFHAGLLADNDIYKVFLGGVAVYCFFIISGFLIFQSYFHNKDILRYSRSRFARIYPLYFVVVVSSVVVGKFFSYNDVFNYYMDSFGFLTSNLFFMNFLEPRLPGVFEQNGNFGIVNGSLWTIKIEVMFYILVPFIYGYIFKFRKVKTLTLTMFFLSYVCLLVTEYYVELYSLSRSFLNQLPQVLCFFMVGVSLHFLPKNIKWIALFVPVSLLLIPLKITAIQPILLGVLVYSFVFVFPGYKLPKWFGDISYGVYLWHFPVIQSFISLGFYDSFYKGLLISFIVVICLSFFSWNLIEKKFLVK